MMLYLFFLLFFCRADIKTVTTVHVSEWFDKSGVLHGFFIFSMYEKQKTGIQDILFRGIMQFYTMPSTNAFCSFLLLVIDILISWSQ